MRRRASSPLSLDEALAPVREALLIAARDEAEQILAAADDAVREVLRQAREQAEQIRAQARARGTADAAELVAAQRSRAGRQARAMILAAQRAEYDALREAARAAVARLRDEPNYPQIRARLVAVARASLGDGTEVHDAPGGGVLATAPGRSADLSLARLADRAVDAVLASVVDVPRAPREVVR